MEYEQPTKLRRCDTSVYAELISSKISVTNTNHPKYIFLKKMQKKLSNYVQKQSSVNQISAPKTEYYSRSIHKEGRNETNLMMLCMGYVTAKEYL